MAELKPCPKCGVRLRKKVTVRKEIVFDHPRNGCKNEGVRVRNYLETIDAWNRRAEKLPEMDADELRNITGCPLSMCKDALQYAAERAGGDLLAIAYLKAKILAVRTDCSFDERVRRFIE